MGYVRNLLKQVEEYRAQPRYKICLQCESTDDNHPFFREMVVNFYREATSRHPKYKLIPYMVIGVAICKLPPVFDDYYMMLEGSSRRNHKKARRKGYVCSRIDFNDHLDEIWEIRKSAPYRQGRIDQRLVDIPPNPCTNPETSTNIHDYPYFGVYSPEGKLVAYAGCLVAGELMLITHIFGHACYQKDAVVPFMIIEMCRYRYSSYPNVRYYGYGTYFGASRHMQRFKRKLCFKPARIEWDLG